MPLVVPGLSNNSSSGDDKTSKWASELMGKKLGDSSNETTFAKSSLPKEHRIVGANGLVTTDYKPERLNIHTDEDGTVRKVTHG